jgi:hypothetical protein
MVSEVNKALSAMDFHIATAALKTFLYNEFCDFYLVSKCMGDGDLAIYGAREVLGKCRGAREVLGRHCGAREVLGRHHGATLAIGHYWWLV